MKMRIRPVLLLAACVVLITALGSGLAVSQTCNLALAPDQTVLSPALLKEPIAITGSGWKAKEIVVVDLILPKGVTVKGVAEGEDVGVATATADEQGNIKTVIGPMTVLMTFFQAGWDDTAMKPDMTKASPLPPGAYILRATGTESEKKAETTLTLLPPPKKE